MSGIATRAAANVPRMLPAVESAYSRPADRPDSATLGSVSRSANGATAPISTTGTTNNASTATNEPITIPAESESNPCSDAWSSGRAANGTTVRLTAAASRMPPSALACGRASATLPPSQ